MKKILSITTLITMILLFVTENDLYSEDFQFPCSGLGKHTPEAISNQYLSNKTEEHYLSFPWVWNTSYSFEEKDIDYEETQLRRFEIIFFISLPVSFFLSLAGLGAFKAVSGKIGDFGSIDYRYLALSSFAISFSVALHDNRVVYKKGRM